MACRGTPWSRVGQSLLRTAMVRGQTGETGNWFATKFKPGFYLSVMIRCIRPNLKNGVLVNEIKNFTQSLLPVFESPGSISRDNS